MGTLFNKQTTTINGDRSMSFYCHAKQQNVTGETRVLVPAIIRNVDYIGITAKKMFGRDKEKDTDIKMVETGEIFHGWEVVKEIAVCESMADQYLIDNPPVTLPETKQITQVRPKKKRLVEDPNYQSPRQYYEQYCREMDDK